MRITLSTRPLYTDREVSLIVGKVIGLYNYARQGVAKAIPFSMNILREHAKGALSEDTYKFLNDELSKIVEMSEGSIPREK